MRHRAASRFERFGEKDIAIAVGDFVKAVTANPDSTPLPPVPDDLMQDEINAAIDSVQKAAASAKPESKFMFLLFLANLYEAGGDKRRAEDLVREAEKLDPTAAPNGHRIVIICDGSGSMINRFAELKGEVAKVLEGFRDGDAFNIVVFQDNTIHQSFQTGLVRATAEAKGQANRFMDRLVAMGTTDPFPAFDAAFAVRPHSIYLFSDGDFPDQRRLLDKLRRMNNHHRTNINTIGMFGDDVQQSERDVLQTMAKENGGAFREIHDAPAASQPTIQPK